MGVTSGFPVDLVLFGMIAAFLVLRLRSVLGRRTGFEGQPETRRWPFARPGARSGARSARQGDRVIEGKAEPVPEAPAKPARTVPDPSSPAGQALARMRALDRNFDPARFLDGAEAAFRMIVAAFTAGNREALRPLLSEDTFAAFALAITTREQAGETQRTEIRAITSTTIEEASLRGSVADITVRLVSDQINLTLGRDGHPVAGTDALTEIVDIWSFERDLTAASPTWKLVAARSG